MVAFGLDERDPPVEGRCNQYGDWIKASKLQRSFSSIEVVVRRRGFGYPWKSSADELTSTDPKRLSLVKKHYLSRARRFDGIAGQISVAGEGRLDEHLYVGAKTSFEVRRDRQCMTDV